MEIKKWTGAVAAAVVAVGVGIATAPSAPAADNIKIFGEQERLNNPNGTPYIGYTVKDFGKSNDPVPHNGTLYSATLMIDGFGGNANPMIERFGARAEKGEYYPSIWGASNVNKLYFDVVGPVPNSVVWNDGIRDILAWVPGEIPLEGFWEAPAPPPPPPSPEDSSIDTAVAPEDGMPVESSGNLGEATPNVIPNPGAVLEEELASPFRNR